MVKFSCWPSRTATMHNPKPKFQLPGPWGNNSNLYKFRKCTCARFTFDQISTLVRTRETGEEKSKCKERSAIQFNAVCSDSLNLLLDCWCTNLKKKLKTNAGCDFGFVFWCCVMMMKSLLSKHANLPDTRFGDNLGCQESEQRELGGRKGAFGWTTSSTRLHPYATSILVWIGEGKLSCWRGTLLD